MATIAGVSIFSLIQADNGHILAGVRPARIYRSTDDGLTWSLVQNIGSSPANSTVRGLAKTANGALFAAVAGDPDTRGIWYSADHGANWFRIKDPTWMAGDPNVFAGYFAVAALGSLVVAGIGDSGPPYSWSTSVNSGATWLDGSLSLHGARQGFQAVTQVETSLDNFYLGTQGPGPSFVHARSFSALPSTTVNPSLVATGPGFGIIWEMIQFGYTDNNGRTRIPTLCLMETPTRGEIWMRDPRGAAPLNTTFTQIATVPDAYGLYADPPPAGEPYPLARTIYAGTLNGTIFRSENYGYNWSVFSTVPNTLVRVFLRTAAGALLAAGDGGQIYRFGGSSGGGGGGDDPGPGDPGDPGPGGPGGGGSGVIVTNTASLGREATAVGLVPVANKFGFANVTHVLNDDGDTLTPLQFDTNPPYTFFGNTPAAGHAVYFGCLSSGTSVPGGPFASLVFNVSKGALGLVLAWEYWDGDGWEALAVADGTDAFRFQGEASVHWQPPDDWATTTVGGIEGYWARVRIDAIDGAISPLDPEPPIHDTRFIYTVNLPYVEVGSRRVAGDMPALARFVWRNLADKVGGSPDLPIHRLLAGVRSYARGPNFNAYLNISDAQSPFGHSVTGQFAGGAFVDSPGAPTGRAYAVAHSGPGDLDSWEDLVEVALDTTVARDYYGSYRAFLRCVVAEPGTTTTWRFRLAVAFGSGGGRVLSKDVAVTPAQVDFATLDLGRVSIPSASAAGNNLGDRLTLTVQGLCTTESVTSLLYDLVLLPIDEWSGEAVLPDPGQSSVNGVVGGDTLEFDSIGNPKANLAVYHRRASGLIQTLYRQIANGQAMLQANSRQRIWFLAMRYHPASGGWVAPPSVAGAVRVYKQQRYLGMRGDQ